MLFFYKFFYIFFLYYSNFKNDVPWFGALGVIVICIFMFCISLLGATGLFYPLMDLLYRFDMHPKVILLIFGCLTLLLIGRVIYFILFEKMKISKEDGKHPKYKFTPTSMDKFKVHFVAAVIFASPFIVKGIMMYYEGKLFK